MNNKNNGLQMIWYGENVKNKMNKKIEYTINTRLPITLGVIISLYIPLYYGASMGISLMGPLMFLLILFILDVTRGEWRGS